MLTKGCLHVIIVEIEFVVQMAKNTDNKRIAVKHVRDKAKSAYEKQDECYICGTSQDLELHHTHSITLLLRNWAHRKSYDISTDEGIIAVREEFIEDYHKEIYEDVYTLCNRDHVNLHRIYGKSPSLESAPMQNKWIEKQKAKFSGDERVKEIAGSLPGSFSKFYIRDYPWPGTTRQQTGLERN